VRTPPAAAALLAFAVAALVACRRGPDETAVDPAVPVAVAKTRAEHPERFRRKILVLGFDSCDPDLVDEYVREGKLTNFARLRREGAYGPLGTLQPILSPVVWTTMATGATPQRHGILDFVTETPAGRVPVSARMRQADAVWDLLGNQGEQVGVVGWLVTWPAEKVNGFLVADRLQPLAFDYLFGQHDVTEKRTWPDALAQELKDEIVDPRSITLEKVRPFLDVSAEEFKYEDFGGETGDSYDPRCPIRDLRLILATAETFRNVGERLYAEKRPRFFACYFEAMDAISHLFMPYAPPKTPQVPKELYLRFRNAIEANYVWHDRVLGEFMDLCDEDTTLLVVSDHGFKSGDFRMAQGSQMHEKTGAMWHRPYGVLYAWGNGVARGASIAGASVYDLAPTVLASMGYPVPTDDMPGRVLTEMFEGGLPFEKVKTYHGDARRDAMARRDMEANADGPTSAEEEEQLRKLQTMGYIGGDRSDPTTAKLNLGRSLLSQGRTKLAYDEFKKVLETHREPIVLNSVAEAALRFGKLDEAEACIDESLLKDPDGFEPYIVRAMVLVARTKFAEAEAAAREAVRRRGDAPVAWQKLAMVLQVEADAAERKGDAATAERLRRDLIETYEKTLRLEPRQPQTLKDLARARLSSAPQVEEVEKSLAELDRVLEMTPRDSIAQNQRAVALLRLGIDAQHHGRNDEAQRRLENALEASEKAISLHSAQFGTEYVRGLANKAYVLWRLGRTKEAADAGERVRALSPSYVLSPGYVAAMAESGRSIAPPAVPPGQNDVR
jgi:predicted AlkP superfamily phosphohydrolase/phosphomutase/tetratricopeptide (TPR) repeat protein